MTNVSYFPPPKKEEAVLTLEAIVDLHGRGVVHGTLAMNGEKFDIEIKLSKIAKSRIAEALVLTHLGFTKPEYDWSKAFTKVTKFFRYIRLAKSL